MGGPDGVSSRTRQPGRRSSRRRSGCRPGLSPPVSEPAGRTFRGSAAIRRARPRCCRVPCWRFRQRCLPGASASWIFHSFFHRILNPNLLHRYDGITTNLCMYTGRRVDRTHGGGQRGLRRRATARRHSRDSRLVAVRAAGGPRVAGGSLRTGVIRNGNRSDPVYTSVPSSVVGRGVPNRGGCALQGRRCPPALAARRGTGSWSRVPERPNIGNPSRVTGRFIRQPY